MWFFLRVLVILLSILIIIGLVRLKLEVCYCEDEVGVFLKVLFLKFKVFPKKFKSGKVADEEKRGEKNARKLERKVKKNKKKSGINLKRLFANSGIFLAPLKGTLRFLNCGFKIKNLEVDWQFARGDAFKTAVNYGKICGIFFSVLGIAGEIFNLNVKKISVVPNFVNENSRLFVFFCAQIGIGRLVCGVFRYFFGVFIGILLNKFKSRVERRSG